MHGFRFFLCSCGAKIKFSSEQVIRVRCQSCQDNYIIDGTKIFRLDRQLKIESNAE